MSHVDHRISSVEQRIASDVPKFSQELSELLQENLSAVFDGLLYTWRLCTYTSPKYAFGVLVKYLVPLFLPVKISILEPQWNWLLGWWLLYNLSPVLFI
jgi:hypothetical protein